MMWATAFWSAFFLTLCGLAWVALLRNGFGLGRDPLDEAAHLVARFALPVAALVLAAVPVRRSARVGPPASDGVAAGVPVGVVAPGQPLVQPVPTGLGDALTLESSV